MTLKALETRKAALLAEMEAFKSQLEAEGADLKAISDKVEKNSAEITELNRQIAALEQLDKLTANKTTSYAEAKDPSNGFANLADFAQAVYKSSGQGARTVDSRLINAAPTNFHQETGSMEGFEVPGNMTAKIWDLVYEGGANLINLFKLEPTLGNMVQIVKDETTSYGTSGVRAFWRSEADQMTSTKLLSKLDTVQINELYAFTEATEELLADSPRLQNRLSVKAPAAIRAAANDAIINGNGVGKPEGFGVAPSLVAQAKESGQAAATITAANIAKMYSRLLRENGVGNSFWLVNPDAMPQLLTLTLGDTPIFHPNFKEGVVGTLLGRPVYESEYCQTLGTAGDIYLINPDGYAGFLRQGISFADSMHLYFDYNLRAFRWIFRMGGKPYLSAPVSAKNGANTKSHFVTLATRA
jgi:HK97 family phage major capsid protein